MDITKMYSKPFIYSLLIFFKIVGMDDSRVFLAIITQGGVFSADELKSS